MFRQKKILFYYFRNFFESYLFWLTVKNNFNVIYLLTKIETKICRKYSNYYMRILCMHNMEYEKKKDKNFCSICLSCIWSKKKMYASNHVLFIPYKNILIRNHVVTNKSEGWPCDMNVFLKKLSAKLSNLHFFNATLNKKMEN